MNAYDPYDDAAIRAEARQLVLQERMQHRLRLLNDRRPAAFDTPGPLHPDVQQWLNAYLAGDRGSLILTGEIGTGKSWTLWQIAEQLVRASWNGRYEIAPAYDVKAATDRPVDTAQLRVWKGADLFAIDELGDRRINDWDAEALSALIDTRWQRKRPTLIASNHTAIKDIVGARAASRLAEDATVVRFTGDDRRRNP